MIGELTARAATLATAESLTGGRVAATLTAIPGASRCYLGGFVTYATALKQALVGVPEEVVEEFGVVSPECARAMACGARRATGARYALSTTGVAGPEQQEGKHVGLVFVGVDGPEGTRVRELRLSGGREQIQEGAVREAIRLLVDVLTREEPGLG